MPDLEGRATVQRVLDVLRPYASSWSGTLGRGDLVIPQREIPRLIHEILEALREEIVAAPIEASERAVFDVLMGAQKTQSVQEQVAALRRAFVLVAR